MTNAQRQAKWREKNRALFNFRRRQKRKNLSGGETVVKTKQPSGDATTADSPSAQNNFPVPVLAEPTTKAKSEGGEARESTTSVERLKGEIPTTGCFRKTDSRGGGKSSKNLSGGVESRHAELVEPFITDAPSSNSAGGGDTDSQVIRNSITRPDSGSSAPPAQTSPKSKIEELRALVKMEQEKPRVEAPVALKRVYRSETGMVITKEQWEEREAEKNKARSKGFEIDEYAQT